MSLLIALATPLEATDSTHRLVGTITDTTGQPLVGAIVVATPPAGPPHETRTGAAGHYRLDLPFGGRWVVGVFASGFHLEEQVADVAGETRLDLRLVLAAHERVTVVGRVVVPRSWSAAKADTDLKDLPFSVQSLSERFLWDQRALTVAEAMRNVSGVAQQVGFGGLNTRFTIRGFRPPAQLKNGFRQNAFIPLLDLQNAEAVEVLKGPASALYGAFEPGGVINIVTKKPLPVAAYTIGFTGGSYGQLRPTLDATGPLGPVARYRFNAALERADSHRDFFRTRLVMLSPVLDIDLGTRTKLTLEGEYLRRTGGFDRGFGNDARLLALPPQRNLGEPTDNGRNTTWVASYLLTHAFDERWSMRHGSLAAKGSLKAFFYTGGFPLLVGTRYNRRPQRSDDYQQDLATQTELLGHLETGRVKHRVLIGFEVGRDFWRYRAERAPASSLDIFEPVYGAVPGPFSPFSNGQVEHRYAGLYLQDQMTLAPRVKALVGLRQSWVDQHEINRLAGTDRSRLTASLSPRAGVSFEISSPVSLYASVSRSSRAETLVVVQGNRLPDPAIGTQVEGGVKTSRPDGRFVATFSVYRLVKQHVAVPDPTDPAGPQLQVGKQLIRGVELDASGEPARGVRILVSAAATSGKIAKDTTIPVGTPLLNVPNRSSTVWISYEVPEGRLAGVGLGGGLFHTGRRAANATASFSLPAYTLFDATVFYERGRYRVALHGKNLSNRRYFESGGGFVAAYPGQPRAVFTSLLLRF